ncbi:hypothetical protein K474DRAFT_1706369 [Panus rudis PR-1116 ss-1]|nr:hypothetical protein K474DRAFT_1706369 [Panus rudis PR-1116 ss-1]
MPMPSMETARRADPEWVGTNAILALAHTRSSAYQYQLAIVIAQSHTDTDWYSSNMADVEHKKRLGRTDLRGRFKVYAYASGHLRICSARLKPKTTFLWCICARNGVWWRQTFGWWSCEFYVHLSSSMALYILMYRTYHGNDHPLVQLGWPISTWNLGMVKKKL